MTAEDVLLIVLAATTGHVDGRDLLDELHPRKTLDIKRRVDGRETWHEGDWLSNLRSVLRSLESGDDRWKLYATERDIAQARRNMAARRAADLIFVKRRPQGRSGDQP